MTDSKATTNTDASNTTEYLQTSCTENECRLCRLPPYARKSGMKHSGLTATAQSLGVEAPDA